MQHTETVESMLNQTSQVCLNIELIINIYVANRPQIAFLNQYYKSDYESDT